MTKLTTERLEQYAHDKHMCNINDEIREMAQKLLEYEQAAKNPVAWVVGDEEIAEFKNGREVCVMRDCDDEQLDYLPLYAAPVLPKQPELIGMKVSIDTVADNIGHRLFGEIVGTSDSNGVPVLCIEVTENNDDMAAPAQPVIPDEITSASAPEVFEIAAEAERLGIRGTYSSYAVGWNACRAEMLKAQQNEPQNIPKSIPAPLDAQDLELYVDMLENSDSDDEDGELNNTQLIVWLKELQRRRALSAQPVSEPYKSAANDIIAERQRQISAEGWTVEHDDEHTEGEIASAAACYALFANDQGFSTPAHWPWGKEWWKQAGQRRDLVKAGALILAEIERMDRIAPAQESE